MNPSDKTDPGLAPPVYTVPPVPPRHQVQPRPKAKMGKGLKIVVGCGVVWAAMAAMGMILMIFSPSTSGGTTTPSVILPPPPPPKPPKEIAKQNVSVSMKWSKGGFDTVMLADLTVTNRSIYAVKDLEITCTHYANSGTQIDSNTRTLFEIVPPNSKKTFKRFNMGFINPQVARSGVEITGLEVAY